MAANESNSSLKILPRVLILVVDLAPLVFVQVVFIFFYDWALLLPFVQVQVLKSQTGTEFQKPWPKFLHNNQKYSPIIIEERRQ